MSDDDTINDQVLHHSMDPLAGVIFDGRYQLTGALAEGGVGRVYEAVQLALHRPVAIKLIHDELASDRDIARRFVREAQLLTRLAHPNIVEIYDFGESPDGVLYLVMERLRGSTLDALLAEHGRMRVERVCQIGIQICDALIAAHARGVVHRDLKPANVMLIDGFDCFVKVLDFGLAKAFETDAAATSQITTVGAMLGTPLYMAPEAIRGEASDPRTDLYALGCLLYELVTGRAPFAAPSSPAVMMRQLGERAPALVGVPPQLASLVALLLEKTTDARPESALVVRRQLAACLAALTPTDDDEKPTLMYAGVPAQPPSRPGLSRMPTTTPPRQTPPPTTGQASRVPGDEPRTDHRDVLLWLIMLVAVALGFVVSTLVLSRTG
jgi:eukaryotic-like serine/threonine-protein kinase